MMKIIQEITQLINQGGNLSEGSCDLLFESLYPKIKQLANYQLYKLNPGEHISATVLVNECYLKLKQSKITNVKNRKHFFSLVARSMRHFLIDLVKNQNSKKRKGINVTLNASQLEDDQSMDVQLLDLDRAIDQLKIIDKKLVEIVELRFFAGLSMDEIAKLHNISLSTVFNQWKVAQAMLNNLME